MTFRTSRVRRGVIRDIMKPTAKCERTHAARYFPLSPESHTLTFACVLHVTGAHAARAASVSRPSANASPAPPTLRRATSATIAVMASATPGTRGCTAPCAVAVAVLSAKGSKCATQPCGTTARASPRRTRIAARCNVRHIAPSPRTARRASVLDARHSA